MIEGNGKTNKLSSDLIVKKVIEMFLEDSSQELFSAIKENPKAVRKLTIQEIRKTILNVLGDRDNQKRFKNGLDALSSLDESLALLKIIASDIVKYYNEYSGDIRNYQENNTAEFTITESTMHKPHKFLTVPTDPTIGNPCPRKISELTRKFSSVNKSDIINTIFQRLLIDMFKYNSEKNILEEKYSKEEILSLLQASTPDYLQSRIYRDFNKLNIWQKKLLGEYILKQPGKTGERLVKGYDERSAELSNTLQFENIKDFTVLHRDILAKLVKSYQNKELPESNFYYLNGITNNKIFFSTKSFGSLEDLSNEISVDPDDSDAKLKAKIQVLIEHKIYAENLGIFTLLPDYKNEPANFIEGGNKHFALPIKVNGIDGMMRDNIYKKLFPDSYPNASLPIRFDVGFLIRGSNMTINEGVLTIVPGESYGDGIYPIIICDGVAIVVHDFAALKELANNLPITNFIPAKGNPLAEEIANMLHNMFLDEDDGETDENEENTEDKKNIYNPLIYGTRSSIRTEFRTQYPVLKEEK